MPYETTCPKGHRLQVSDSHLGQRIQCPACNESFVVPDGSRPPVAGPAGQARSAGTSRPTRTSDLGRFSLLAGRPMVAVGLVLVLLSKGCDSISLHGVERAEAMAKKAVEQFDDDAKSKELDIQRQIDEIAARGEIKPDDQKKIDDLKKRGSRPGRFLRQRSQGQRGGRVAGIGNRRPRGRPPTTRSTAIGANCSSSSPRSCSRWDSWSSVGAREGAERWVTLMMLAIITFSLFVGGGLDPIPH